MNFIATLGKSSDIKRLSHLPTVIELTNDKNKDLNPGSRLTHMFQHVVCLARRISVVFSPLNKLRCCYYFKRKWGWEDI